MDDAFTDDDDIDDDTDDDHDDDTGDDTDYDTDDDVDDVTDDVVGPWSMYNSGGLRVQQVKLSSVQFSSVKLS